MKKEKRILADILKDYYEDMFFKTLLEKDINYLKKNKIGTKDIEKNEEKIRNIERKGLNAKISLALGSLTDETDKKFLEYKYGKKQNTPELMYAFGCGETNVWRKENKIFDFLKKYLVEICDINLEESWNKNEKVK